MLEGSGRRKVRRKERLLLQRVSWLPPWVGVGNSHDARADAGAPSVRGLENHASLRVRCAIKKSGTQRHRAISFSLWTHRPCHGRTSPESSADPFPPKTAARCERS